MNELMIFNSPEFGEIRTIDENGSVLFCATDVARALGYSNPRDAICRHCRGVVKRDGVSLTTNQHGKTTKQAAEMSFIPEGDLYRLAARSKLPGAEKFESWIFDEVIPSIRKHGGYINGQENMTPEELKAATSKAGRSRWDQMTPEQREAHMEKMQAARRRWQEMRVAASAPTVADSGEE